MVFYDKFYKNITISKTLINEMFHMDHFLSISRAGYFTYNTESSEWGHNGPF